MLKQLLNNQHISRAEFDVVMETNAYLRAIVRGQASANVTEDLIKEEFNFEYGERVRVRAIPVLNPQEVAAVREALAVPGARFEDVARRMGRDPALAQLGGLLPEFTRTTTGISKVFIDTAFSLKPGEVSTDTIQDSNSNLFYVIKVEDRIPPKVAKLDDVREGVRAKLVARLTNNLMAQARQQLAQQAVKDLQIADPALRKQFEDRRAAANPKPADKREVQRSLEDQGSRTTTAPAAAAPPAVAPSNPPASPTTTRPATTQAR